MRKVGSGISVLIAWLCAAGWIICRLASFLYGIYLWNQALGLIGIIIGFFYISDLALPFVIHLEFGEWPWLFVGLYVATFVFYGFGKVAEDAGDRIRGEV